MLTLLVSVSISTKILASISTYSVRKFLARQIENPSRKAQSSAVKLEALLIFLANPITQFPLSSLIIPPPPATPNCSEADPCVFNFSQPVASLSHLIDFLEILAKALKERPQ